MYAAGEKEKGWPGLEDRTRGSKEAFFYFCFYLGGANACFLGNTHSSLSSSDGGTGQNWRMGAGGEGEGEDECEVRCVLCCAALLGGTALVAWDGSGT